MIRGIYYILILVVASSVLTSCWFDKSKPNIVYFPDMYYPTAYDPYQEAKIAYSDKPNEVPLFQQHEGMTALTPVNGTVPKNKYGLLPYDIENTNEGYDSSKKIITSPLDPLNRVADLERGKKMFEINCAICHGVGGDGQGNLVKNKAYVGVPNYKEREITVGSVFHVIMYGKNAMGSYASQLQQDDRWRIAEYVLELKNK